MNPPVVAVDFRGGRPEADFVDLLDVGAMPHRFIELIPPGLDGTESVTPTAESYARLYADALAGEVDDRPVLIGLCSGALIALALADELDVRGAGSLAVGLFDAEPMGFEHVVSCYAGLTSGGAPPRETQEAARDELTTGSFGDATAALLHALETDLRRQLDELGVPPEDEQGRELLDRQTAWFRYILAASGAPAQQRQATFAVYSEDCTNPLLARIERRFPISSRDLLRSPDVREETLRLLRELPH